MKPQLIAICGPTGVGKTALALKLAPLVKGAVIACDSRQVYAGMDVGTGKDIPPKATLKTAIINSRPMTYYHTPGVDFWGYDLVKPDQAFSVMDYVGLIRPVLDYLFEQGVTPILTAGTGFYLKSLFSPPATGGVVPDPQLRRQLIQLSLHELQQQLQQKDPVKWQALNHSDRLNPRRLIRALEVAQACDFNHITIQPSNHFDVTLIGLSAPLSLLDDRINLRVMARAVPAFTAEVKSLLRLYPDFLNLPAASATGYRPWAGYIGGQISRSAAIQAWQLSERQYARRQLTWFKKIPGVQWLSLTR